MSGSWQSRRDAQENPLHHRRSRRLRSAVALITASATALTGLVLMAPAATAATETLETSSFYVNANDLDFILRQIQIAEAHDQRTTTGEGVGPLLCASPTDSSGKCVPDPKLPLGLRTVDGSFNNLVSGRTNWGAADEPFDRLVPPAYQQGTAHPGIAQAPGMGQDVSMCAPLPAGTPAPLTPTCYEQFAPGHFVYDTDPRTISNLIVDQTETNPAAINAAEATLGGAINPDGTISIPNTATDEGLSAQSNTFFAFFGQFFDHGLDLVNKGGNGTVIVPLQPDDPLYEAGSNTNFLTLTRAERGAGADGVVGTADDTHNNQTTPYVDQNQTYTSHPSHQVFIRKYEWVDGALTTTGELLDSPSGGIPTWHDVKTQARETLGIDLADDDVLNVPMVATDIYGNLILGPSGMPLLVTADGTVEASRGSPVDTAPALHTNHAFLDDIAHGATPLFDCATGALVPQEYDAQGEPIPPTADVCDANGAPVRGSLSGYDNVALDDHFITGDGRGNENIGLTAVHHVFHSEHNNMVAQIEDVLAANPELDKAYRGLAHTWPNERQEDVLPAPEADDWSYGQRLFQAARFVTEMQYQHLVFEEFARTVQPAIDAVVFNENSYNPNVNADIPAEFAHSVYRFGHSMMTEDIQRTGFDTANVPLLNGFLNPRAYDQDGTLTPDQAAGSIIMGTTSQAGSQIDEFIVDTLRNNLLGLPLDLATINLLRARDTGTPGLQAARQIFYEKTGDVSLRPYANWVDFGNGLKNGNIFGRGGLNASLVNFVAAYGTHPTVVAAQTIAQKRLAASYLVNGAPIGEEYIQRIGGTNRYDTAALLSRSSFETASVAYIASGADFPDALVGGPAAALQDGPILLTAPTYVPIETSLELVRLKPSRIVVLGSVSPAVGDMLEGIAPVTRLTGTDRYDTAAKVSASVFTAGVDRAYIAVGTDFPDALAGGAVASKSGPEGAGRSSAPILLTRSGDIPMATQMELERLQPQQIIVLGGTGAVSPAVMSALDSYTTGTVTRQAGSDRWSTATAISAAAYPSGSKTVYVSTGTNFPDALAAAPVAGRADAPLLLVPASGTLPTSVAAEITRLGVERIVILGGPGAVSAEMEAQLAGFAPEPVVAPDDRSDYMNATGAWSTASTGLDRVDFWTGGLAERLNPFGGMLGTTFNFVFENTLEDLQFGDRFYYLFRNQGNQLFAGLEGNSFASLIERNTDASNIPAGVFHVNQIEFDLDNPTPLPYGFAQLANGEYRFVGEEHIEMHGTAGNDRMRADQGDDSLWGREGDDTIEGGSGNDLIHGGVGDDIITDLFGDDEIRAGKGNDAINGGPGFDLLLGGGGDDFVTRGGDIGDVFLGDGDDTYLGGTGRANIFGGEGDDWVEGGSHADLAQGDNANQFQNDVIGGDDVVLGRGGDDDIEGEGGDDILVGDVNGTDRHLGNMGWDWVTYYGQTEPVDADFTFTLLQRPDVNAVRDRYDQLEGLSGGAGNDTLRGPGKGAEGEFTGNEEYLHKMTESTLDLVGGLREMLFPAGMNFGQQFMRNGPIIDSDGFPSIILGGQGSDIIEGRAGNDYLDGDAYLAADLARVDASGAIVEMSDTAADYRTRLLTGEINPGDLEIVREIRYDNVDSGAVDVAEYAGVRSAYDVVPVGPQGSPGALYWKVTHAGADEAEESDGVDVLRNIEVLQFADTCLVLTPGENTPTECVSMGELRITAPDPINEGDAVVAELFDMAGNPYDLSGAQNVRFTWVGGEGDTPDTVNEQEELTIGGIAPDGGTPNKSTFRPDDSAVGQLLLARVSFEVDGITHVVISGFTALAVQGVNDVPVPPGIGGSATVGATLMVGVPSDGDGAEEVVFTYTWEKAATATAADADWTTLESGSDPLLNAAYEVTEADAGAFIRVVITYTDNAGQAERAVTPVLGPVAAAAP